MPYCIMSNYWDIGVVPQYKVESYFSFLSLEKIKDLFGNPVQQR